MKKPQLSTRFNTETCPHRKRFNSKHQKSTSFLQPSTSPEVWFGTRGSEVQILWTRLIDSKRYSPFRNASERDVDSNEDAGFPVEFGKLRLSAIVFFC